MPSDEENTAFWGEVFIIDDVDFTKPNVGQKAIEPTSNAVGKRNFVLVAPARVLQPPHTKRRAAYLLETSPTTLNSRFVRYIFFRGGRLVFRRGTDRLISPGRQTFPSLCGTDVLQWMVHPRLVASPIIAGKHRTVVIHLQFTTSSWSIFVLIDVGNLVRSGRLALGLGSVFKF